jgi:DNA replication licensing factor MCM6
VKEAFRLLNKSIIRVETPDIDFEEDQQLLDGEGGRGREGEREEGRERESGRERVGEREGERESQLSFSAGEGEDGMVNGVNGLNGDLGIDEGDMDKPIAPEKPSAASTRKIRVTYEEYKSISNLLILHLRQMEEMSPGQHTMTIIEYLTRIISKWLMA